MRRRSTHRRQQWRERERARARTHSTREIPCLDLSLLPDQYHRRSLETGRLAPHRGSLPFLFFSPFSLPAGAFELEIRTIRRRRRKKPPWPKMLWLLRFSGLFSAVLVLLVLSPALLTSSPAEAIRSSHLGGYLRVPGQVPLAAASTFAPPNGFSFRTAPSFRNAEDCGTSRSATGRKPSEAPGVCDPSLVHIAMTLDAEYMRGSMAAVHSVLQHARCPESVFFHLLASETGLVALVRSVFPQLRFKVYHFDPERVRRLISPSVRRALEQPLNYARNYLASVLEPCVRRVIYLDSDLVVVDDIAGLWRASLGTHTVGAPEYCRANFTRYFTGRFWADPRLAGAFAGRGWGRRRPCYFNTGVMVVDLARWRRRGCTRRVERWMQVQRDEGRIYELGSLPPLLLVFAGRVAPVDHRWNQHGLGGDNVRGSCRELHPGPVSLLHWSGSGKPWVRLDAGRPCPIDTLWAPYDLHRPSP